MGKPQGLAGRAGVATAAQAAAGGDPGATGPGDATPNPGLPPAARARVRDELMTLEYPRHLHKPDGAYLRVENETEARAAVADGWCVSANSPRLTDDDPDPAE